MVFLDADRANYRRSCVRSAWKTSQSMPVGCSWRSRSASDWRDVPVRPPRPADQGERRAGLRRLSTGRFSGRRRPRALSGHPVRHGLAGVAPSPSSVHLAQATSDAPHHRLRQKRRRTATRPCTRFSTRLRVSPRPLACAASLSYLVLRNSVRRMNVLDGARPEPHASNGLSAEPIHRPPIPGAIRLSSGSANALG